MFPTIAVAMIYAVVLGGLLAAYLKSGATPVIGFLFGAALFSVAGYQSGLLAGPSAASTLPAPARPAEASQGQCSRMFELLAENNILLEQPRAERLVVSRAAWSQIPETVREQIVQCAGDSPETVEIVQR